MIWCNTEVTDENGIQTPEWRAWFKGLWSWYRAGGVGHVIDWLLRRDVSRFDPKGQPLDTEFKRHVIESSKHPEDLFLEQMYEDKAGPFGEPVVTSEILLAWLRSTHGMPYVTAAGITRHVERWSSSTLGRKLSNLKLYDSMKKQSRAGEKVVRARVRKDVGVDGVHTAIAPEELGCYLQRIAKYWKFAPENLGS